MKGKITLLVGGAVGYVLGSRAGRQRYEQIKSQAQSFWTNPKVQEKATQAQDYAKDKAPVVKDKAAGAAASAASATKEAAGAAKDKVSGDSQDTSAAYPTSASTTGTV
ncbi:hypothetical protein KRR39_15280 [Nocardioides panacis]|uniref:YtxH domain-containing protein n=1 Tax=Nocardioides panacis TaxID=2849501 RepID=A0A975XYY5_9ACTN|nr:hypothetical protein [Nocardioides panacis]QWZ06876.1 hypothetical protein KRR39_15280 [Nocardioides panacis]